ncbi:MAG: SUMF1/EgtB/PvdO family nonheme iron enzyme [Syntrophobacteraceae bacterium]|jgi:formylglycine-generating enzyme required for sulfatase activity
MRYITGKITLVSFILAAFLSGVILYGDPARATQKPGASEQPEKRTALVIGNAAYASGPLRNPINDARAMAKALGSLSFEVTLKENLDQKQMKREIQALGEKLQKGGVGLFYYAGHGIQVNGHNYLLPVGAAIEHEKQVEYEAVDMGAVLSEMDFAHNRMNIVIMDACRDNPFARSFRSVSQGLASVDAPTGTLIAYATAPGSVANDGQGENGIYTGELVRAMVQPGLKIEDVFKQVRSAVREATTGRQTPWESSSLEGDFYFLSPPSRPPAQIASIPAQPNLPGASERSVSGAAVEEPASRGEKSIKSIKTWKEPATGLVFVWMQGGCFLMGSPKNEKDRSEDEGPVHEVCVDGFWISKTVVTNGQLRQFQKDHDSRDYAGHSLNGDSQPAVFVSWRDANNFSQWLTGQNGGQYNFRLPTEGEWEYTCRAGSETSRYWGEDTTRACIYENVADYTAEKQLGLKSVHECEDGYAATAPVGSFQPNAFGLYDMLGNVFQWCSDVYGVDSYVRHDRNNPQNADESMGQSRVIRGGCWHGSANSTRCAARRSGLPDSMNDDLGFRVVREP